MKYATPISVIIPTYNGQKFITAAIRSVLEQSFEQFELIIVNDGSIDNTERKIKQIKDPRIKYVKNVKNKGNAVARNLGISLAKGKYICMMDSDDISLPNRLSAQYNYLETNRHIGCIGSLYDIVDENRNVIHTVKRPLNHSLIKTLLLKSCLIHQPTIMLRHSLIKKHNLYYDKKFRYAEDYDFFVRASRCIRLKNLDTVLVKYRRHSNQISTSKRVELEKFADKVRKRQLMELGLKPNPKEIELHLKLFKHRYLIESDLKRSELWFNKLLKANSQKKIYNVNLLYKLLRDTLKIAMNKNKLLSRPEIGKF